MDLNGKKQRQKLKRLSLSPLFISSPNITPSSLRPLVSLSQAGQRERNRGCGLSMVSSSLQLLPPHIVFLLLHGFFPQAAVLHQLLQHSFSPDTLPVSKSLPVPPQSFPAPRALPAPSFLTLVSAGLLLPHNLHFSLTHCLLFSIFYPFLAPSQRPHPVVGPLEPAGTSCVPHGAASASQRQFCSSGSRTVVPYSHSIYFRTTWWEFLL